MLFLAIHRSYFTPFATALVGAHLVHPATLCGKPLKVIVAVSRYHGGQDQISTRSIHGVYRATFFKVIVQFNLWQEM